MDLIEILKIKEIPKVKVIIKNSSCRTRENLQKDIVQGLLSIKGVTLELELHDFKNDPIDISKAMTVQQVNYNSEDGGDL